MKVFLPFQINGIGGTNTFARNFQQGMRRCGHEVYFKSCQDYDLLLAIVHAPFRDLVKAKRLGRKVVQRLDGVYYWSVAKWRFPLYNLRALLVRQVFADFTIYQSRYSRYCVRRFLGAKRSDPSAIIYNGCDLDVFTPIGPSQPGIRTNPQQRVFFTASAFRREDQIVPIFRALEIYRHKFSPNFRFVIAGTFSGRAAHVPTTYQDFPGTVFLGKKDNTDLPGYARTADAFLFTHLNPPCPNNVIEALACGLPVCGVADGAMPEIVTHGKEGLLLQTQGNAFWKPRELDLERFADNLNAACERRTAYSEQSRITALARHSLQSMTLAYVDCLQRFLDRRVSELPG